MSVQSVQNKTGSTCL